MGKFEIPIKLVIALGGEDADVVEEQCPGVYLISVEEQGHIFRSGYYVVTESAPADAVSDRVRSYGKKLKDCPGLLIYSTEEAQSGYKILEYEMYTYLRRQGLPLPSDLVGRSLEEIIIYRMEYHPEYFGLFPIPEETPYGSTIIRRIIDNGIYALKTDQGNRVLAICYPLWRDLTEDAIELGEQSQETYDRGHKYLFYLEEVSCIPLFELWNEDWDSLDCLKSKASVMTAICRLYPEYAMLSWISARLYPMFVNENSLLIYDLTESEDFWYF